MVNLPGLTAPAETTSQADRQPGEKDNLYTLHHQVIPGILFSDSGSAFFNDLFNGNTARFMSIVEKLSGKTYAAGMKVSAERHPEFDMVLISFPEPAEMPLLYHAALVRKEGAFRYLTLEKTVDFSKNGSRACLCDWTKEHVHRNYGPRSYDGLKPFREEVIAMLKKQGD
jgi:hypothetical protein